MPTLYNVDSPINREQRNNINGTFEDILKRFQNLQRQINFLAGGEEVEQLLERIDKLIKDGDEANLEFDALINDLEQAISLAEATTNDSQQEINRSTSLRNELTKLKQDISVLINTLNNKETTRSTAESIRVSSENVRIDNENVRISSEIKRNSDDKLRSDNESTRENSEQLRVDAENIRVSNENERKTSESTRKENENKRINDEQTRKEAEELRKTSETSRSDSELERTSNEANRVSNEELRKEAETSRVSSEEVRLSNEEERNEAEVSRKENEVIRNSNELLRNEKLEELKKVLENMEMFEYDATSIYEYPNFVSFNGSTYLALKEVKGIEPTNDKVNYQLIAQRGVDGTGSVSSVEGIMPDNSGNVTLGSKLIKTINSIQPDSSGEVTLKATDIIGVLSTDDIQAHAENEELHITATERTDWNAKVSKDELIQHTSDDVAHVTEDDRVYWNLKVEETDFLRHVSDNGAHVTQVDRDKWDTKASTATATTTSAGLLSEVDKAKLDNIEAEATKTVVENVLTSTSETNALSAAQGSILRTLIESHAAAAHLSEQEYESILSVISEWESGTLSGGGSGTGESFNGKLGLPTITEVKTPSVYATSGVGVYVEYGSFSSFGLAQAFGAGIIAITFVLNANAAAQQTQLLFTLSGKVYMRTGSRAAWKDLIQIGVSEEHTKAIASSSALGHVKVGSGLAIAEDGTLSATATGGGSAVEAVKWTPMQIYPDAGFTGTCQYRILEEGNLLELNMAGTFDGSLSHETVFEVQAEDSNYFSYMFEFGLPAVMEDYTGSSIGFTVSSGGTFSFAANDSSSHIVRTRTQVPLNFAQYVI